MTTLQLTAAQAEELLALEGDLRRAANTARSLGEFSIARAIDFNAEQLRALYRQRVAFQERTWT